MKYILILALLVSPAFAAENSLDEIVVTATRQSSQPIQAVPMSITAIDVGHENTLGAVSLTDLAPLVPSLNVEDSGPGLNKIDIRGISTGAADIVNNIEDRPLVAVYIDDTPISMQGLNPDLKVFDLERVEVLRGPQGTLYGASSMGGTIRYITRKPDTEHLWGTAEIVMSDTVGGGFNYGVRSSVNLPINDRVAVMLSGYNDHNSGWINNLQNGEKHENWDNSSQGRAAVRYKVNDNLTLDASVLYERLDTGGTNYSFSNLNANQYYSLTPTPINDNMKVYNFTANYVTDIGTITSSTSAINRQTGFNDQGQYLSEFFFGVTEPTVYVNQNTISQITQEIRMVSNQDQKVKWIGGLFYNHLIRKNYQDDNGQGFDQAIGINSLQYDAFHSNSVFSGVENTWEHEIGAFGEVTYSPTDRLDLTAGVRYFRWEQNFYLFYAGIGASYSGPGNPGIVSNNANATGANPKFNISYHITDNTLVFAEAARGFRYGGVNQFVPVSVCGETAPTSYGPDHLWTYSLGEKSTFDDKKLSVNATAFLIKWSDVQTEHYLTCSYAYTQNEGQVQSTGGELELAYRVRADLTIGLNGSVIHAVSDGALPNVNALSGEQTPYTPKYLASATAEYTFGFVKFNAEYAYHGSSGTRFNPDDQYYRELPAYSNVNLGINIEQNNFQYGVFVRNVANSNQITMISPNELPPGQPGDEIAHARPRTIGIRAAYSW